MKLADAISAFLEQTAGEQTSSGDLLKSLVEHLGRDAEITDLAPERLFDFLNRSYIAGTEHSRIDPKQGIAADRCAREDVECFSEAFARFVDWGLKNNVPLGEDCRGVVEEARDAISRALEISERLAKAMHRDRDAFGFPEFLTTFEEGGRSEYGLDSTDPHRKCSDTILEGYFRIARVEGTLVEAVDTMTGELVGPIDFPPEVATLLARDYVIELELVRDGRQWRIGGCGFAYPPGAFRKGG
jgi:hypothetical protein